MQSVVEKATPTSCTEVRCFTGLANYYRRFVEGYAEMAAPLTALGSPTARFAWSADAQASFDAIKLAPSSALVLRTSTLWRTRAASLQLRNETTRHTSSSCWGWFIC